MMVGRPMSVAGRLVSVAGRPNLGGEILCFWRETDNLGEFRREIHQFKAGRCKIWAGTSSPVAKRAQVEWRNWREVSFWKILAGNLKFWREIMNLGGKYINLRREDVKFGREPTRQSPNARKLNGAIGGKYIFGR